MINFIKLLYHIIDRGVFIDSVCKKATQSVIASEARQSQTIDCQHKKIIFDELASSVASFLAMRDIIEFSCRH